MRMTRWEAGHYKVQGNMLQNWKESKAVNGRNVQGLLSGDCKMLES